MIYKSGAKEIASQEGYALTYMAKFNEREGNSCHIHLSLAHEDGTNLFAGDDGVFETSSPGSSPACASSR